MAMHSSSVRMRPAIGARSVDGGAAVCAKGWVGRRTRTTTRETPRRKGFIRPREYHGGEEVVDDRWTPFSLTPATFCVVESPAPQDIGRPRIHRHDRLQSDFAPGWTLRG